MRTNKNLVLAAMVFAVAMTFIDQTIVAIAIPNIQKQLSLSPTGTQWVINGYLLALSALFAFGGKLGDVLGRKRMVLIGVTGFAIASAACGLTPKGSIAEPWIIFFRVVQGATAALLFPAAVAIVVASFPLRERGKAMAIFFGISGGLTAIGPIAGGFLTQWTWRAIFWINIPVAIIAVVLTQISCPDDAPRPQPLDYRGTALITGGMGLTVLGFEQSSVWGWSSAATWICVIVGLLLMVVFVRFELGLKYPLLRLQIFADRGFATDTLILGLMSIVFVPFFFFGSVYAQVALGKNSSQAGEYILWFFIGFVIMAQVGGRMLDRRGVRPAVVLGGALGAVGFFLLAGKLTDLSLGAQSLYIAIAGGGLGLMLGPASTDAVNRAPSTSYSEVTGITQTARNFGASLGLAVLGAILISRNDTNVTAALTKHGVPNGVAHRVAASFSASGAGSNSGSGRSPALIHSVQLAFAHSTQTVFYIMAGVMVVTFIVAVRWLPRGRVESVDDEDEFTAPVAAPEGTAIR
ncbi:MAG TPA: MFS transporter [Solirubrobacteraceae bacterium]|nr:MFS transporter [Solirubrobacteraceae bacterium]